MTSSSNHAPFCYNLSVHLQLSLLCLQIYVCLLGAPRRGLIYLPRCIANFTTNLLYSLQVQWICTVQLKAPAKSLLLHSQDKWGPVLVTLWLPEQKQQQKQQQEQEQPRQLAAFMQCQGKQTSRINSGRWSVGQSAPRTCALLLQPVLLPVLLLLLLCCPSAAAVCAMCAQSAVCSVHLALGQAPKVVYTF